MLYSHDEYKLFQDELEGGSIGTLWSAMRADNFGKDDLSFNDKKAYFFELLQRLMQDGKIKLAKHGVFLDGTIEEQIARYKAAFPDNEDKLVHGLWFTFDESPGGIVWVHDNGDLDWT
ncbi:Uncharacterized protein conserved in bacteria [Yersinia mollaretii]|uniref:DUF596 domain-containing protein n=1 Tax=Yersinia mollaretii TaxID=33060 RepID=UPI0005E9E03A|nr:DUF596 domain-containing protein [Yersinia mollaretii]CNK13666.1 Uncharacterized protein conserved in bacteria [Yersinia mollaretii]